MGITYLEADEISRRHITEFLVNAIKKLGRQEFAGEILELLSLRGNNQNKNANEILIEELVKKEIKMNNKDEQNETE